MRNRLRTFICASILAVPLVVASVSEASTKQRPGKSVANTDVDSNAWYFAENLPERFLVRKAHLDCLYQGGSVVTASAIRLTSPKRRFILTDLSQLKGWVRITSRREALHFVRLRTARRYCGYWPGLMLEIINTDQVFSADFADTEGIRYAVNTRPWTYASGTYAVLSPRAYKLGHFQAPSITYSHGAYVITRYVCDFTGSVVKVEKWRESVSTDGTYHRDVIMSEPASKVPEAAWQLPHVMGA